MDATTQSSFNTTGNNPAPISDFSVLLDHRDEEPASSCCLYDMICRICSFVKQCFEWLWQRCTKPEASPENQLRYVMDAHFDALCKFFYVRGSDTQAVVVFDSTLNDSDPFESNNFRPFHVCAMDNQVVTKQNADTLQQKIITIFSDRLSKLPQKDQSGKYRTLWVKMYVFCAKPNTPLEMHWYSSQGAQWNSSTLAHRISNEMDIYKIQSETYQHYTRDFSENQKNGTNAAIQDVFPHQYAKQLLSLN